MVFRDEHTDRRPLSGTVAGLCGIVLLIGLAFPAVADESVDELLWEDSMTESEEQPQAFNGGFLEGAARGGPLLPAGDTDLGWMADIGVRASGPMYTGDYRLAYQYGRWSTDVGTMNLHGLHGTLGLHPLFLALLGEGLTSHFLSSLHLELGLGPQFARLTTDNLDEQTEPVHRFGVAASVGVGFDLPITDPNRGQGLWVNTVYRRNWSTIQMTVDEHSYGATNHFFSLGLAWRSNGTLW